MTATQGAAPPAAGAETAGAGTLFLVVGPSGSGKDTLIGWLRQRLAHERLMFVRRTVTRRADAASEDHDVLDADAFRRAEAAGRFAVTWEAHGLRYGLPAALARHLDAGGVAIANGSRRALPAVRQAFPNLVVVSLEVGRAILAERLAARGRESAADIAARLDREAGPGAEGADVIRLDNSGPIEAAGEALMRHVGAALDRAARPRRG